MSSGIKMDDRGFVDTRYIDKELNGALESDVKYRQTDYMKKRAVKVAGSYDEFKNMVACAHLKTVNRKEVEELGIKKKGWTKSNANNSVSTLLSEDLSDEKQIPLSVENTSFKCPKSMMEYGRDWRRMRSDNEKTLYVVNIGVKKMAKLLNSADDFELLEDIIVVIMREIQQGNQELLDYLFILPSIRSYDMLLSCLTSSNRGELLQILSTHNNAI